MQSARGGAFEAASPSPSLSFSPDSVLIAASVLCGATGAMKYDRAPLHDTCPICGSHQTHLELVLELCDPLHLGAKAQPGGHASGSLAGLLQLEREALSLLKELLQLLPPHCAALAHLGAVPHVGGDAPQVLRWGGMRIGGAGS